MGIFRHLVFVLLIVEAKSNCYGPNCDEPNYLEDTAQCSGLECESKESLLAMIGEYQKAKHQEYLAPSLKSEATIRHFLNEVGTNELAATDAPQCNICSQPGLCNNGMCVPDATAPWKYFYCVCPDNTSGKNCQTVISCKDDTCGKNANCYVANHQVNCICKPGYSALPNGKDCNMKVKKTCMSGDPHYVTYDGLHFDYQGTCPYVFTQPCTILPEPYGWFSVRAKNEFQKKNANVSIVSEVEVDLHNLTIHIDGRSKTSLVNGVRVLTPWYYPDTKNWTVRITYTEPTFTIENDQGIVVTFYYFYSLCVQVPDIPEFNGNSTLCGLGGNIDSNKFDDVVNKNGTVLDLKNTDRQPKNDNYLDFMKTEDTWITDNFLPLRPNQENCLSGHLLNNITHCDIQSAAQACYPIQQAENGDGPFGACQALGNDTLDNFYYDCIYDMCRDPTYKCTEFTYFFRYCQQALPQEPMNKDWRSEVNCPLACTPNAHPSICTSSCPSTCSEPFPEVCDKGCIDGCECDPGYVIDNTVTGSMKCIRIDQCGCTDTNGNPHQAGKPWLTQNCTIIHECQNGSMWSYYKPCSDYGSCVINSVDMQCACDKGFRGDGYNCTDINECVETPGICNHGQCVNTPGSYHCDCEDFWVGDNCNAYKPRRHCADLFVYWDIRANGVNYINPPFALPNRTKFQAMDVFCDMTTNGGGYTLMSSDTKDLNSNKTFQEYINGFGTPAAQSVWIGLEFIHQMTFYQPQALRLNLHRCASNGRPELDTYCTYPTFSVLNSTTQYSVVIRESCNGTEADGHYYQDGWARWDLSQNGPKFSTWDLEVETTRAPRLFENDAATYACTCSKNNLNTGWWYIEDQLCGAANLNGVRYSCPSIPVEDEKYLRWAEGTLGQASMWLRPVGFPKYDKSNFPSTKQTFVFAYSNDLDKFTVETVKNGVLYDWPEKLYATVGDIRFDVKKAENINYHTDLKSFNESVSSHMPNPSLGYGDDTTESDVFNVIQKFLNNTQAPVVGAVLYIVVKRHPNTDQITNLVADLQRNNVFVYFHVDKVRSGGQYRHVLFDLASQTNGFCVFASDDGARPFTYSARNAIGLIRHPFQYFSQKYIVSGSGSVELPAFKTPNPDNSEEQVLAVTTVQDTPLDGKFISLNYTVKSVDGTVVTTFPMNGEYWNQLGTGIVNYFQLSGNVEYKWSIDYHYSSNTSQTIEHRVYGSFYHDFLPFIN